MKKAIVVITGKKDEAPYEDTICHGVFENGDAACRWAFDNCKGFEWHWQELWLHNIEED